MSREPTQTTRSRSNADERTETSDARPARSIDQGPGQGEGPAGGRPGEGRGCAAQVDQRSTEAGDKVGGFASDVRSVGDQLREQGKDQPAKLADQAAERAERVGELPRSESDADRILGDVEDFGRRQPWVVIAGGDRARRRRVALPEGVVEPPLRAALTSSGRLPERTSSGVRRRPGATRPAVTPPTPPRFEAAEPMADAMHNGRRRASGRSVSWSRISRRRPRPWCARRSSSPARSCRRRASWPARAPACWPAPPSRRCSRSAR